MAAKRGRKTTAKPAARAAKNRRRSSVGGRSNGSSAAVRSLLPLFLSACIVFCIGVFVYLGYRSVTASNFFEAAVVEVNGANRSSGENIKRIVAAQVERTGVWNADLPEIRSQIEKQPFVRSAAVSRILPNGISVEVFEHEPKAVVKTQKGNFLVDKDGRMIAKAESREAGLPFTIDGWDETKSEKADKENAERVKLYQRMLSDWQTYGIESRVLNLDLSDLRDPRAVIEDSGTNVMIAVGRENFGENLSKGIKAIVGKGQTFEAVQLVGSNMILAPRRSGAK